MPLTPSLPTWVALNNANNASETGITDVNTGQPIAAGGLNRGAYFDVTEQEANQASFATNGICHSGRYRWVLLDSGATAANVKTGTVGYLRAGSFVQGVVITTAGTGATAGTYTIPATVGSGGGSGAIIQVVVNAAGVITAVSVVNGGSGYVSVPSFSLTATGTVGGVVAAQLNSTPNTVTSADQVAAGTAIPVRPVVFLNSPTPGNYTFVQELGLATVLGKAGASGAVGDYVNAVTTDNGLVTSTVASGSPIGSTIGRAADVVQPSLLFKAYLGYAALTVQD
jgi:hypothetical protein